jgi:hypothetical protein
MIPIPDRWLFPYDSRFDVAAWLSAHSPRAWDTPDFARWIDEAAKVNNLNAKWLLMTAEKEQSFLTRTAGGKGWQRALDYTLGYGATDGGDIPKYKGIRFQVQWAAKALRLYLTAGRSLYVGDMVGHVQKYQDGTFAPRTLAEAAQLQYTPWLKYLPDTAKVWESLFGKDNTTMKPTRRDVFNIAYQAVQQRLAGDRRWTPPGGQTFVLDKGGYCARFVRQCYETAMGIAAFSWEYAAPNARAMEYNLKQAGLEVDEPQPGDIVCLNDQSYKYGHIAIYAWVIPPPVGIPKVGGVFENTSSAHRGNPRVPGTKWTPFSLVEGNVSGYYSPLRMT